MKHHLFIITLIITSGFMSALAQETQVIQESDAHRPSIMAISQELEDELIRSGQLLRNEKLEHYCDSLLNSLVLPGERFDGTLKVLILRSIALNAFATPHGTVYICTGMLARMENEAQLAALLGHEMTHIMNDHAVLKLSDAKKKSEVRAELQTGLGLFLGGFSGLVGNVVTLSAITGYSRDLEAEADRIGLQRMHEKGYAPIEFRNLFFILRDYIMQENIKEPYFFSTHPRVIERIESFYQIIGNDTVRAAQGKTEPGKFQNLAAPAFITDAAMNAQAGRFDVAKKEIMQYLEIDPYSVDALVLMGDVCRLRDTLVEESVSWYSKAIELDETVPQAHRNLGLYYYEKGDCDKAKENFEAYLDLLPGACDLPLIRKYLTVCSKR